MGYGSKEKEPEAFPQSSVFTHSHTTFLLSSSYQLPMYALRCDNPPQLVIFVPCSFRTLSTT